MAKYGDAAIKATRFLLTGQANSPPEAWSSAVRAMFPISISSQQKGCPKTTYLGLCEDGLIKGVPPGKYTRSSKNKCYAVDAVKLLKQEPTLADDQEMLWSKVVKGEKKKPNNQMDVVISLWKKDLIA
ncbi:MAG: hypothetical protein FJ123_06185 [Deltaproteobacteria bacterium]|nr:hypothetical protein [Deltaproteobacteria bacterium]